MVVYFLITYIIILVSYNLSFILEKRNVNSVESGWMISILFLAITIPGFCITPIVRFFKNSVVYLSFLALVIGFLMILILKNTFFVALGVFLIGGAYGIVQPLIYDKTSLSAKPQKAVFALACVMSANYLAIYLCPYIASGFQAIFHQKQDMAFPFWVNMIMASILVIISFIGHKSIIFSAESSMFHEKSESGGSKAAQAVEPTEPTEPTVNPAKSIQVDAANKTAQSTARPENTQTSEEAQIKKTEAQKSDTVNSDLKSSPKTDSDVDRAENKTEDIKAIEQSKNDKIIEIKAPEQNADDKTSDDEATKRSENDQSKTDSKDNVKE